MEVSCGHDADADVRDWKAGMTGMAHPSRRVMTQDLLMIPTICLQRGR